ncbi:MAG: STAS domain-containing protein [Chlorobi bacterium]|nr:STAS domain-containing protein [Chlorobiota bacterium]
MQNGFRSTLATDQSGVTIVELYGYLDAHTAPQLDDQLTQLMERGCVRVVIDFLELEYISSAGLGVFLAHIESFRAAGGDLKLSNLSQRIRVIAEMLGFQYVFEIYPTRDDACNAFTTC